MLAALREVEFLILVNYGIGGVAFLALPFVMLALARQLDREYGRCSQCYMLAIAASIYLASVAVALLLAFTGLERPPNELVLLAIGSYYGSYVGLLFSGARLFATPTVERTE